MMLFRSEDPGWWSDWEDVVIEVFEIFMNSYLSLVVLKLRDFWPQKIIIIDFFTLKILSHFLSAIRYKSSESGPHMPKISPN